MSKEEVIFSKNEDGMATITLNRPHAANALSVLMLTQLQKVIEIVKYDRTIRCVIVSGSGQRVFCAGADLKERANMNVLEVKKTVSAIQETIHRLEQLPQPVIASLNGSALGGGLELALACDLRVASHHAQVGLPETALAIIPGAGGTQRLARLIGKGRAKELIFTAKKISAAEAEAIGLVEYAVSPKDLDAKVNELAQAIIENGPVAVQQAKLAIDKGYEVDLSTGLVIEQQAYELTIPTKDRLEGLQAFKEKRKPIFSGE